MISKTKNSFNNKKTNTQKLFSHITDKEDIYTTLIKTLIFIRIRTGFLIPWWRIFKYIFFSLIHLRGFSLTMFAAFVIS